MLNIFPQIHQFVEINLIIRQENQAAHLFDLSFNNDKKNPA